MATDDTVYISCRNRELRKLSSDHTLTKKYKTLLFNPQRLIFNTDTNSLLVVAGPRGVFSVTESGIEDILRHVEFQSATDIALNCHGDIAVCDWNRHEVFVFNSEHKQLATYDRHRALLFNDIWPRSVTCDSDGHFIIVDSNNFMLHVINNNGDTVNTRSTREDCPEPPLAASMSTSGYLWVGFFKGHVCVYRYNLI